MKNRIVVLFSLLTVLFCFSAVSAFAGQITVWGSTTCQKRFLEPGARAFKKATGDSIKVYGVGTGKGLMALIDGKTDAAAASSPLKSAIKSAKKAAKKAGKEVVIPDNLVFNKVAEDVIVPIVHKNNPVDSLTWKQLADLNTGKIKNWSEVGGPNMPVKVITSHAGSATRAVFQKKVMKKKDYADDATLVRSTRLELQKVSRNPGAVGAVSEAFFKLNSSNCKIVKTKDISRPLALITIGKPTPDVQKILDFFASAKGRKFITD